MFFAELVTPPPAAFMRNKTESKVKAAIESFACSFERSQGPVGTSSPGFPQKPEEVSSLKDNLKKTTMSDQPTKELHVILCDMCVDKDRKPALKTCMKCEISMCVEHLNPHLTTPVLLQTHPLTAPVALGATARCPQHCKLLEYYCLDDLTCVCVSCAIEDQHRLHNMKTVSTACKELKEKLVATQQNLLTTVGRENESLREWARVETEKVTRSGVQLVEAVNNLRDLALVSIQNSVSARMATIKTSKDSLQAAQRETDTFSFLQMYSQVYQEAEKAKAVDLRRGVEPGDKRDNLVQKLSQNGENMVAQAERFWKSLVSLVDPEKQTEIFSESSNLTFDPRTSDPCVTLSRDKRKIFYSKMPAPQSQRSLFHIKDAGAEAPSSKLKGWVLSMSWDYDWTIGLCPENNFDSNKCDVFGLRYIDKTLKSLPEEQYHDISLPDSATRMQTYEVIWNQPDSLSFSLVAQKQRIKIVTIKLHRCHKLTPFVCLMLNKPPLSHSLRKTLRQQTEWRCCGKVYYIEDDYLNRSYQNKCSCGKLIGGLYTTDLLCELQ